MDLTISVISLLAILIMVATLIVTRMKKIMMTYGLIIANLIVFFLTFLYGFTLISELGFRPIYLELGQLTGMYTLFTSMFVHSGFPHIFGNMLVFFFMGIAFEQRIGWKSFVIIYFVTGVCGALTHAFLNIGSSIPLVGASGAIFGILGAFAFSYPRDEVVMPIPIGIMIITRIKVIYAAILFAVMETVIVMWDVQDSTAHFAHLGGLVSGVILAALLLRNRRGVAATQASSTVHYDSGYVQKPRKINFKPLFELAKTPKQHEMLKRIQDESVPQVRDMWLEHFVEQSKCPVCGKSLHLLNGKVWCKEDHYSVHI